VLIVVCLILGAMGCKKGEAPQNSTANSPPAVPSEAAVPEEAEARPNQEAQPTSAPSTPNQPESTNRAGGGARPVEDFAAKVEKEITPENYKQALGDVEKAILELEARAEGSAVGADEGEEPTAGEESPLPTQEEEAPAQR
ncbi:MAG: hypothetical protein HUU55_19960, partial [Myxococcales bacterium]|nr:hypothetical protein [Myxococcales bacterium]